MHNDGQIVPDKKYRCKITNYPDGNGELSFYYDEPIGREERRLNQLYPLPRKVSEEKTPEEIETNQERAFRRAKSKCRKLAMTMNADRLLTLTTRELISDRAVFDKLFVRFIKAVHRAYPNWKYVDVAELQKRGAWHAHLAVAGFQDVAYLRKCWTELVDGNIDVTSPRVKGNKKKASAMCAAYLTKYMSKAFKELHESGKYRYRASNGIEVKYSSFWIGAQTWREAQVMAAELMDDLYGGVGSVFFADDWGSGWMGSWSLSKR